MMFRMSSIAQFVSVSICCLTIAGISGCRPQVSLVPAEGILLLDGQPLPDVLVTFMPEAAGPHPPIRSMGMSDESGRFTVRAETLSPGALAGEHRVIVEDLAILKAPRADDGTVISLPDSRFPSFYSDPLKTPLRATVQVTQQPIELHLHSRPLGTMK
jgi:hypothetical protein